MRITTATSTPPSTFSRPDVAVSLESPPFPRKRQPMAGDGEDVNAANIRHVKIPYPVRYLNRLPGRGEVRERTCLDCLAPHLQWHAGLGMPDGELDQGLAGNNTRDPNYLKLRYLSRPRLVQSSPDHPLTATPQRRFYPRPNRRHLLGRIRQHRFDPEARRRPIVVRIVHRNRDDVHIRFLPEAGHRRRCP